MDIYLDVRAYIVDVFGGNPEDVSLDWNAVGGCIHYFDNRRNIQFRLWERSEDHLGIPDMTLIVVNISLRGIKETARSEMTAFLHWLQQTAKINGLARSSLRPASRSSTSPPRTTNTSPPTKSPAAA